MKDTKESAFSQWTKQKLESALGLVQADDLILLKNWVNAVDETNESEKEQLLSLWKRSKRYIDDWNEVELIHKFIAPVINLVDFDTDKVKLFGGRKLTCVIEGIKLTGIVDAMVASGRQEPIIPYFCFHEYKRTFRIETDPAGQVLAEMVAAQALNNDGLPIYGLYVFGKFWNFVILDKKQYAISNSYNSISEQLFDIFRIMRHLKKLIEKRVNKQ